MILLNYQDSSTPAILTVLLVFATMSFFIYIYNRLIRLRNMANEAWSGIDVQLKKRHDLIPNIVNIVAGYASHEKKLFESITMLRAQGVSADTVKTQETAEVGLCRAIDKLFVVVENYPELKANQNFLELQRELAKVENDIQRARRYYNGSVRNYNILVEQFPSNLVARVANHRSRDFFDINNQTERQVPLINL